VIRRALGVALIALAAASIYMSWGALYEFAIATGMPPERAIVFPAIVDVVTVVSMLIAILVVPHTRSAAIYPWLALVIFGALTIAGNGMHVVTAPAGTIRVDMWIAVVANSMPAIALLLTTHLAAVTVYRRNPSATVDGAANEVHPDSLIGQIMGRGMTVADVRVAEVRREQEEARRYAEQILPEPSADPRQRVLELHAQKRTLREIQAETGVSRSTASRWINAPRTEVTTS
jgi:DNA-binding phage protein